MKFEKATIEIKVFDEIDVITISPVKNVQTITPGTGTFTDINFGF